VTTQQTTRVVPAGWYQDPADDAKVRWWNGLTWTEHVEMKPTDQRAAEARELERQYGISTGESEIITRRASKTLDARGPATGTIPVQGVAAPTRPIRTGTTAAWLLSVTPVLTTVLTAIAGYVYFYVSPTPLVAVAAIVLVLMSFLWAVGDNRALENRGLTGPPAILGIVPLVGPLLYLIARRGRISGSSPLIVWLVLFVVAILAPAALAVTGGAASLTKALEVQRAVHADLVGSGSAISVTCPPILESTATGTVFTCDATLPSGDIGHVWVSFDSDEGHFSWALANR